MPSDFRKILSVVLSVAIGLATLVGISAPAANAAPALPASWNGYGLREIERYVGKYQASTDGFSDYNVNNPAQTSGTLDILRPTGASTVTRAFLTSSSGDNGSAISDAPTATINGQTVTWGLRNYSTGKFTNYLADVTSAVNSFFASSPSSTAATLPWSGNKFSIPVVYDASTKLTDAHTPKYSTGVALTVIFANSSMTNDATVIMYFGSARSAGQDFVLSFPELQNATAKTGSWMSLGIGWSQGGGTGQFSTIKAHNSSTTTFTNLSGSAGGCDDTTINTCSDSRDGLLTVGGVGDDVANPTAFAPSDADDELYTMDSYLATGVSSLTLNTYNNSSDDNIFQAAVSVPFVIDFEANFDSAGGSAVATEFWTTSVRGLTASVRAGYVFDGWFLDGGTTAITFPYTPPQLENQQFYAHWTQQTYTATFDTHGGSTVNPITYTSNFTLPTAPTRTGYTFIGWYRNAVGGAPLGATYTPNPAANLTIHAQWYQIPSNNNSGGSTPVTPSPTASPTPTSTPEPPVVVVTQPQKIKVATLVVAGFADGSPLLASITRAKITAFVKAHKAYKKASCTGYTEGPTVLKTDAALSASRGKNACDLVSQLTGGKVKITSVTAVQSKIESAQNRRVKIVMTSH